MFASSLERFLATEGTCLEIRLLIAEQEKQFWLRKYLHIYKKVFTLLKSTVQQFYQLLQDTYTK